MEIAMSKEMKKYFQDIDKKVKFAYSVAAKARSKGLDPEDIPPVPLAKNMAERVEGLISTVVPEIGNSGLSKRIKELEEKFGDLDWRVAMSISLEVAQEKICKFSTKLLAMETGIRVGIAYLTLGIVASPIEGFVELKLQQRKDGKEYFCLMFSGPIRSAGGTASAVSTIVSDYVRKEMGYFPYDPTEDEINRMVTELYDYHERVTNLQYLPSREEIAFLVRNLPVQIAGDPSEQIEVSQYKDLKRIETNRIRSGVCLVLGEGLAQKAPKLWKQLSKWGKDFGLEKWFFLDDFVKLQKKVKSQSTIVSTSKVTPNYTYISDLVAGRPVLTHPLRAGGFRLRYGRARNTGYSSAAIHPAVTYALDGYIAIGTQLKVERPGKAASMSCCDTIEGPIVKLKNGDVLRFETASQAKNLASEVKEILFLGDILFSYGDFFNRAHPLIPAGYCEEWWVQELEKATVNTFGNLDLEKLSEITNISTEALDLLLKEPFKNRLTSVAAVQLSRELGVPLYPYYTYHWKLILAKDLLDLLDWFETVKIIIEEDKIQKMILPLNKDKKRIFELIGLPHKVINNEYILVEKEEAFILVEMFNLTNKDNLQKLKKAAKEGLDKTALAIINDISPVKLRDKSGYFIGARMGRPEKAKMRKLAGSPHCLFPVGEEGGKLRCFQTAMEDGKITAEFPLYHCTHCDKDTIFNMCETCNKKTKKLYFCSTCGIMEKEECIHGPAKTYSKKSIDINDIFKKTRSFLGEKTIPDMIKGVRGTSNKDQIPEHIAKGILRAKHGIYVNKDGTTRYDMTQLAITHFKPKEAQVTIEKLKELGYEKDIHGKELEDVDQVLELKPQDIILPACKESPEEGADEVLFRSANFIDDLLVKFYGLKPFYNLKSPKDLAGKLVMALAPHTSAAITGRIVGFSKTLGFYAHPMFHAGTRRDCLVYGSLIYVYDGDKWDIKKIGEFVESFNPQEKVDSYGALGKKVSGYSTLGYNECKGKVELVPIEEITKHRSSPTIKIGTENGREIESTFDHLFYVKDGIRIIEKKADNLQEGDLLVVPYSLRVESKNINFLFIPDVYSRGDLMVFGVNHLIKKKIASKRAVFCKKHNLKMHNLKNYLGRDSWPASLVKGVLRKIPFNSTISIKRDNIKMPALIKLNAGVLWLMGLYIAEGFSRKNNSNRGYYQVSFAATEKFIRDKLKKICKENFNLIPSRETESALIYSSKFFYLFFDEFFPCGSIAQQKRIPPQLLNLNLKKLKYLIQGYFDGEGSTDKGEVRVSCDTVSEQLIESLYFALSRYGIYFRKCYSVRKPGKPLQQFYVKKGRPIPKFAITKLTIPSDYCRLFAKEIGFSLPRKQNKLLHNLKVRKIQGTKIKHDTQFAYLKVISLKKSFKKKSTYCLNVSKTHNFISNNFIVHNCDGDEASVNLMMDALLNFSRQFLPNNRGATQDAPLVLTSSLIPAEVDDMVFDLDVAKRYPLEFYEACLDYKQPWDVEIDQLGKRLNTPEQYENFGFTHDLDDLNSGVRCSAYKTIPSMEEKLKGQMALAEKIRAVDTSDVARLVIEKHFIRDIKGNLRKFSQQIFRCVNCNHKYRRPPLIGKCTKCGGKIIFTISEGSIVKYLEPAISLAEKYDLPSYLKQSLELTKRRVEGVFGKDKEKQIALGQWFA